MRPDPNQLATILLVSRLAGDGIRPLKAAEFWRLLDAIDDPGALLGPSGQQVIDGLDGDLALRVTRLLDRATSVAFELERLDQTGIATLTPFDDGYPPRWRAALGSSAPPVLHTVGDPALLANEAVGIIADPTTSSDETVRAFAAEAARLGFTVVHGGANPIDRVAADAATEADGASVGILAAPLRQVVRRPEVRRAILAGTTCLVTPYAPDTSSSEVARKGRDMLIRAQSRVTIVVSGDQGSPVSDPAELADLLGGSG